MKAVCWHRCPSLRRLEPEGLGIGIVGNYYRKHIFSVYNMKHGNPHDCTVVHGFLFT